MTSKPVKPKLSAAEMLQKHADAALASTEPKSIENDPDLQKARVARNKAVVEKDQDTKQSAPIAGFNQPQNVVDVDVKDYPNDWVLLKMNDGRICAMGPPSKPSRVILEIMFKNSDLQPVQAEMQQENAVCMNYVRALNGRILPGALFTYTEIMSLMDELGDLGVRMAFEMFNFHFGYGGGKFYEVLKKNSITGT